MRHENLSVGQLDVDNIIGGGVNPLVRRTIYLDPASGSDGNEGKKIDQAVKTLTRARALITTGKSDAIVLVQSTSFLELADQIDFTERYISLIGNAGQQMFSQRSRISCGADITSPVVTVSGYGNTFANLYFTQGYTASHASHVGWLVSGNYNNFRRFHFAGPQTSQLGGDTAFRAVTVSAVGNTHFDHCVVGMDSMDLSVANALVSLGNGSITTWEDCIFYCRINATTPYFFEVTNTGASQLTRAFFKGCKFIAFPNGAYSMAEAFLFTGSNPARMYFDQNCSFDNVDLLSATAKKANMRVPVVAPVASNAEGALISISS